MISQSDSLSLFKQEAEASAQSAEEVAGLAKKASTRVRISSAVSEWWT